MKEKIQDTLKTILNNNNIDFDDIIVEIPKDKNNGDFSSNIAMQLAKTLKKNPMDIASSIVSSINDNDIEKVEIARPGFINFYLKKDYLYTNINEILEKKDDYGKCNIGNQKRVNIEFVSANPTGVLHLGHARGAAFGSALSNILKFSGFNVTREYYINDAGNQINKLEASIKGRYNEIIKSGEGIPEDGYHGKEIIEIAKNIYDEYGLDIPDNIFKEKGLQFLLDNIKNDLKNFRVDFDVWTSEKSIYERGLVNETLDLLKKSGYTYEKDEALWLKTTLFGDEKNRVLVKKDKTNTYFLPDIAYHMDKYNRNYDYLINVFGADHHGYIPRLKASIEILGNDPDKLSVEIIQMVRLVKGNQEIKMSKRTGNAISINDLVEEVGLDASRYFFLMRSIETQMDFDMDLATKKSNENPVYYVQYAYARICSILREYNNKIEVLDSYGSLDSEYANSLLIKLNEFKDTVKLSALKRKPHIITNYVYDLASLFHTFYAHEKVLSDNVESTREKVVLIKAISIVIKNCLELLGVEAKERM